MLLLTDGFKLQTMASYRLQGGGGTVVEMEEVGFWCASEGYNIDLTPCCSCREVSSFSHMFVLT